MKKIIPLVLMLAFAAGLQAQDIEVLKLDSASHATQHPLAPAGTRLLDDGGENVYTKGKDYYITMVGSCDTPYAFEFTFESYDIAVGDTLFVYDGPDTNSTRILYITGSVMVPQTSRVFASRTNVGQFLTLRFKTTGPNAAKEGFNIVSMCDKPCERITPYIDSIFYKTRNGEIYEFGRVKLLYDYDSVMVWDPNAGNGGDSVLALDSTAFYGVNLCRGDGVIFTGHCDYTHVTGWYYPSDSNSYFQWDLGMGDTIDGIGVTSVYYDQYYDLSCYEVFLGVTDSNGCPSNSRANVRVRLAQNPLKTLFTLADICNRDSLPVNMGYDGDNATLTLRKIDFVDVKTQTNKVRTFIPDGPNCPSLPICYVAPVEFNDFPAGSSVTSAGDICSICVNYEHTYMGDYDLSILCPTYGVYAAPHGKATLKYKSFPSGGTGGQTTFPDGTSGGGSRVAGLPYGLNRSVATSSPCDAQPTCDSLANPYGVGYNYCFSRNGNYTLVSGQACDDANPTNAGMSNAPVSTVTYTFPPIPAGYNAAGQTPGTQSNSSVLDSSDHENKLNYYIPADDFRTLVGCPLNGTWNIEICDHLGVDNGWVFSWSLDICGIGTQGCRYQVGIDSIIWTPDTAAQYHDYDLGYYRGLEIHKHTPLLSYILSPDTAGTFPINVTIYDEFGCVWDTNTRITTIWTPEPNLGRDTALCGVFTTQLDATDRHTDLPSESYTYMWEPFGQNTSVITTQDWPSGSINYVAEVTNTKRGRRCVSRDTITVQLRRQPLPSFMPTPFTLEGCDPLTLTFNNQTLDGYIHHWDFGDGITSELESPTHTYSEGVYDLKYYVTSIDGCIDSLIYPQTIAVYSYPEAAFSWSPTYPSATNPVINLQNLTVPQLSNNKYFWEFQYNQNNPLSVETLTDDNPTFDYSAYVNSVDELPGNYAIRLIARTDNLAPSGNIVYCRDTAENTILVVNDYLTFPSVVTPNGDGINDVFVIGNLIEGMGYPNNTLDIYNRWGTSVYHKENISSYDDFWDPSNVPAGTYFYRFTAHGYNGNIEHNGAIEVIK